MSREISLNGDNWQFKEFYGEDWRWRNAHKPGTRDIRGWRTGSVPGSVHHDLWQLGEIPDPYFERNSLLLEWIPARTWIYKKSFFVDSLLRGKRIQLCFEGVDYEAEFFLNGESLGTHRGLYTPALFDITDQLQYGEDNLIAVIIEPAPHEQPQVSRTNKVRTHKSRMTYWWDFCPRMIHIGIWDDVFLKVTGAVRIEDVFVRPQLQPDFQEAEIKVAIELDALEAQNVEIETSLLFNDEIVASKRLQITLSQGSNQVAQSLLLAQPQLWWPNGHGEQPLYHATIHVTSLSHKEAILFDEQTVRFGVRKIELLPNESADPTARPYTFTVNGQKIYAKGWNWVPIDVLYGVPRPEKLEHLLHLAKSAHVNLLRVWGGGLIEKEAFYESCDELGIMVWQEFIQSSSGIENNPSEAPEFIDFMVAEAEQIIPRKRNHPSLVLWCGGNELSAAPEKPLDDNHALLGALKAVVQRLDPDRLWLPTSPTGRVFLNSLENIEQDSSALHDVHGPWEYQGVTKHYELYNRGTSLLHSEFGVEGVTNLKTLNRTIAPEHQWPPTLDNPYWQHLGAWWNQHAMWRATFGDITDIPSLIHVTQFMQAEGLRYAVETNLRRQYQNSGTIPWQFNEPYPMATCTSAIDYYGHAKPSYYAVARAYEPLHISAKFPTIAWGERETFEAEIWVNNSHTYAFHDLNLNARIIGLDGHSHFTWMTQVQSEPNTASRLASITCPLDASNETVFFLDIHLESSEQKIYSSNRYVFTKTANLAPLLALPATELQLTQEVDDDQSLLHITNSGSYTALGIWLEDNREINANGYVYFSDNAFALIPGETKSVMVSWKNVPPATRQLKISAWNTPTRIV
jgi:beta-mannosidase